MPEFVVVTGTDTGVGKTFVTAALALALVAAGRKTVAIKPVESGCGDAARDQEDGAVLARTTGQKRPLEALVRLRAPLAPALAAEREQVGLDVDALVPAIRDLGSEADVVLVEGAGGLLSPLSWTHNVTHLARDLDARILVVAADRLGALNHVELTIQVLVAAQRPPIGIVLSAPAQADPSTGTNAASLRLQLASFGDAAPPIAEVPRLEAPALAARHLEPVIRWLGRRS